MSICPQPHIPPELKEIVNSVATKDAIAADVETMRKAIENYDPNATPVVVVDSVPGMQFSATTSQMKVKHLNAGTHVVGNHVHGPWCDHEHGADGNASAVPPKYLNCREVPALDVRATFATNTGPRWARNAAKLNDALMAKAASLAPGQAVAVVLNVQAYQWLLTSMPFRRSLDPARPDQLHTSGILGLYARRLVVMTDASLEDNLTQNLAYYWCDIVEQQPAPVEVVVETAEPAAEHADTCGCPQHTAGVYPSVVTELFDSLGNRVEDQNGKDDDGGADDTIKANLRT